MKCNDISGTESHFYFFFLNLQINCQSSGTGESVSEPYNDLFTGKSYRYRRLYMLKTQTKNKNIKFILNQVVVAVADNILNNKVVKL